MFALVASYATTFAQTSTDIVLWEGTTVCADDWSSGYQVINASNFAIAGVGDEIIVTVTEVSSTCDWPQIMLQNGSWANFDGVSAIMLSGVELPYEGKFTIIESMLTEMQSGGLVVKGCGFTFTKVVLRHYTTGETGGDVSGEPVTTVWTGNQVIDWSGAIENGWQIVPASAFIKAEAGMKLRLNFSDLAIGAQGHISNGSWGDMPDGNDFVPLTASYWEYSITDDMLASLKSGGCIVTGIGFTLKSIDLINPAAIPSLICTIPSGIITCWEEGESPKVDVSITNPGATDVTTAVKVIIRTDSYETVTTEADDVTIVAGATETISFPLSLTPGFYHIIVEANYNLLKDFNIGFNPTAIEVTPDAQSDFETFWTTAKNDLAAVAPEYTLTEIPEKSTAKRKAYLVEMKSVDNGDGVPVTIRGYYLEPVAAGTYPVIITQNGYDSGYEPWCPGGDDNPEWIELLMSNRGQLINNREPYKEENAFYGDWFQYNFGNKDKYYYRGAYMDVVRSIDFIASREKAQQNNIFMTGASQGGAFTIAGAALDNRLNAIAPAIQFMGDFPNYFKVGAWPRYQALQQQKELGLSDEELYAFLSYFDTKNLAALVTCPVTTCMGLQDDVCPIRTNFAPFNVFTNTDKHYVVNDNCKHETPAEWYTTYINFFTDHLKEVTSVERIETNIDADAPRYNVLGVRVGADYKGIVISNGKKFVQK